MSKRVRIALACALLAALAGCLSGGPRDFQRFYVLEDRAPEVPAGQGRGAGPERSATLLVSPTTASSFYDTYDIAYSRAPGMRAHYQFNSWTEQPSRTIGTLLLARLERVGGFKTVASTTSGVQGSLVLTTHLTELYHEAASSPGSARVSLTAELTDPARRALVARRTFTRSAPAGSYDAPGAVAAFNDAIAGILD